MANKHRRNSAGASDAWVKSGDNGENLSVFDSPTYVFGRLAGIIRRSFMPAYVAPFALNTPVWRVLAAVAERSSLSFNEICSAITMDRAQVSRTLGTLLTKGYVAQLTSARTGRRGRGHNLTQTKLILTQKGHDVYRRVLPIAQQHQMILLSVLDENERAVVHAALMKMIAAAERFEALQSADPETGSDARGVGVGKSAASGRSATKAARRGSAADADFANPIDP
jgi:DNA-binding MarR family transcriptional regulator